MVQFFSSETSDLITKVSPPKFLHSSETSIASFSELEQVIVIFILWIQCMSNNRHYQAAICIARPFPTLEGGTLGIVLALKAEINHFGRIFAAKGLLTCGSKCAPLPAKKVTKVASVFTFHLCRKIESSRSLILTKKPCFP